MNDSTDSTNSQIMTRQLTEAIGSTVGAMATVVSYPIGKRSFWRFHWPVVYNMQTQQTSVRVKSYFLRKHNMLNLFKE